MKQAFWLIFPGGLLCHPSSKHSIGALKDVFRSHMLKQAWCCCNTCSRHVAKHDKSIIAQKHI